MKIEFSEMFGRYSCNFDGGGKRTHIDGAYEPEKHRCFLDFLGDLATRALEAAIEEERRETAKKIFREVCADTKKAIANYQGINYHKPLGGTNHWEWPEVRLPKQNPFIVSGLKSKVERIQPKIKKVIFNSPATIVFWSDGTKTVVKATNELFDREKGFAMAIAKKFLGNKGDYFDTFKKYIE